MDLGCKTVPGKGIASHPQSSIKGSASFIPRTVYYTSWLTDIISLGIQTFVFYFVSLLTPTSPIQWQLYPLRCMGKHMSSYFAIRHLIPTPYNQMSLRHIWRNIINLYAVSYTFGKTIRFDSSIQKQYKRNKHFTDNVSAANWSTLHSCLV